MVNPANPAAASRTAYLIFDTESIPDGQLLALTKYAGQNLSPEQAIAQAQDEAREATSGRSDFINVAFQVPIAVCVARVGPDFRLQALRCLDRPQYRPREMVKAFWDGVAHYKATLVSFNGRGFDLPLMELAAFRYGISVRDHFRPNSGARHRYGDAHIDLLELFTNYGASRLSGGLDLFSKLLGKPGKKEIKGKDVYNLHSQGQTQAINDYCSFDVLHTYFVFLRTRVLTGEITLEQEHDLVESAREWVGGQVAEQPHLQEYLNDWGDWQPWP